MNSVVYCGECGKKFKASPEDAGRQFNCTACGTSINVPEAKRTANLPVNERTEKNATSVPVSGKSSEIASSLNRPASGSRSLLKPLQLGLCAAAMFAVAGAFGVYKVLSKASTPRVVAANSTSERKPKLPSGNTNSASASDSAAQASPTKTSEKPDGQPNAPPVKAAEVEVHSVSASGVDFAPESLRGLVLIDFFANRCEPCKKFSPIVAAVQRERADSLQVKRVNVDEQTELAGRFQIRVKPTVVLLRDGEEIGRAEGALSHGELIDFLDRSMKAAGGQKKAAHKVPSSSTLR